MTLIRQQIESLKRQFAVEGYAVLPEVVEERSLRTLRDQLVAEFEREQRAGELFSGGGMLSGHLNCFPGNAARPVFDQLKDLGLLELVRELSPSAERLPNVGCNFNLPGSSFQNHHIDGYASGAFMIANVAVVDTDLVNGAPEVSPRTHLRDYKYWEFVLARPRHVQVQMKAGDLLIRTSTLWHRGMPNRSPTPRPMLGFTWEEGGSELDDPFTLHEGRIRFLPNRYPRDFAGRMRERAFAALPRTGAGYLFVRSLIRG